MAAGAPGSHCPERLAAHASPGTSPIAGGVDGQLVEPLASMALAGACAAVIGDERADPVEGDQRAPGPHGLPVCAPVHAAAGVDQHRVHDPPVRVAATAIALGWPAEQIVTIDADQGQSGASAADREGFGRLVAKVSRGRAGIVLGLEVCRLARNNADWHRLLEICAMSGTLICDEDGLYDPTDFNDRLLLGLKGTVRRGLMANSP